MTQPADRGLQFSVMQYAEFCVPLPETDLRALALPGVVVAGKVTAAEPDFTGMLGKFGLRGVFIPDASCSDRLDLSTVRGDEWRGTFSNESVAERRMHIFASYPGKVAIWASANFRRKEASGYLGIRVFNDNIRME